MYTEKHPLISIAMTVFNAAPFLAKTLESLLAQDYRNFELIISDNASEDGSSEICQEFAKRDHRIKYYRNNINMGPARNGYKAADLCSGEFIMPAADHDVYHPNFISSLLELLQRDESVVLAYPRTIYIDENDQPIELMADVIDTRGLDACQRFSKIIWEICKANMVYGLYRIAPFKEVWHSHPVIGADLVLLAKLSLLGSIAQINEPLFFRRRNRPVEDDQELAHRQIALFIKSNYKALVPWTMLAYEHIKVVRNAELSNSEKEILFTDIKNCFPDKFGASMRGEVSELLKKGEQILSDPDSFSSSQLDKYLELIEIADICRYFYPDISELDHLTALSSRFYKYNQQPAAIEKIPYYKLCTNMKVDSSILVPFSKEELRNVRSEFQSTNTKVFSPLEIKHNSRFMRLSNKGELNIYAGDVPDRPEYNGWIGLSLTQENDRHIKHDITLPLPFPDNSADAFQAEDVFEHIQYDRLGAVINEIYRVLKPGALFRLSVPDYGCDVLRERSVKDNLGNIVFDPGGGGTLEDPGHVWFPRIENVYRLLEKTRFFTNGEIEFLHYWNMDNVTFVAKAIDFSKGNVRRTPDYDERVKTPYRPMSLVVDLRKSSAMWQRTRNNILAYPHGWQYPVITEQHAYERACEAFPAGSPATYVGFPWATVIDLIQKNQSDKAQPYIEILQQMPHDGSAVRITVAQHISVSRFQKLFELAGITDLFWPHATKDLTCLGGIRIHPFPLFPVRCLDAPEIVERGGKALHERTYLYSFVGAYDPRYYLTDVRGWIAELPSADDALIISRNEWHYEKSVYEEQVLGITVAAEKRRQLDDDADSYRGILEETVFSLCPSGTGPNSIRLWESLGYGCIPVIMSDKLRLPGNIEEWLDAAIFVREDKDSITRIPQQLRALAEDKEALIRYQQAGRRLWEKFGFKTFIHDLLQFTADAANGLTLEGCSASSEISLKKYISKQISPEYVEKSTKIFSESRLAHQWLDCLQGVEIGPSAHNPFGLSTKNVGIYDEIYEQEQLSIVGTVARLDIVARADQIPLPDESEDFILSSHVIEHCPDLIKTLVEWFRIVKRNGYIFMIVPHRDAAPSDRGRPLTDWHHILADFQKRTTELIEPEAGKFGHCHYHVFSPDTMKDFVGRIFGNRLVMVDAQDIDDKLGNGFTLVFRKELSNSESLPWEYVLQGDAAGTQHSETILVSALVSTYNSEPFISGCLTDLVEQTLYKKGQLEIIVVDSASPQGEGKIVQEFQDRFSNITYIRTDQRETIYQAWNRGIKAAHGIYVTNANADDRHRPDALEVMAAALDANPKVGLVYGDIFVTNLPNQSFAEHIRCGYHLRPDFTPEIMLSGCHMGPQPMWRKSLHEHIGWFHEKLLSAGDYEFWCRIALHAPLLHLPDFLGLYYENPKGFCNTDMGLNTQETLFVLQTYSGKFPAPQRSYTSNLQYVGTAESHRFVNIGMITYNRLEFTRQAIDALLFNTDFPYVLTVVDNASSDGTREYLQEQKRRGIIKNLVLLDENVGVAKASNLAWSLEPEADYYLKLDNDIIIQKPGWLLQMVDAIDRIPVLGAVAYNFEPYSYPLQEAGVCHVRPKGGNLGGACILIPRRTRERLGVWCEEYGLYSEEDADYGRRITAAGLINAYMEDEQIGLHLPAGRAAAIDATTFTAVDGVEEEMHSDYRQWKDEQRRKAIGSGLLERNFAMYDTDPSSLYIESRFAADWLLNHRPSEEQMPLQPAGICSSRLKVAVYTTDGRTEACPQIRSFLPCRALSDNLELLWGVTWRPETRSYDVDTTLAAQADLAVITRFFPSPATADFIEQLLAGPVPVVYDTDDLLTDIDPENTFKSMGDDAAPYILDVMRRAALVTVSNEELKREYAPIAKSIVVLPNMLDDSLWRAASTKNQNGPLVIGYAGGFTHRSDLEIIEEALQWIAQKYGEQVRFRFIGCATEALQSLPCFEGIEGVPGYEEFAGILQKADFDIAIAPLRDTRFNRCKSNVKWLEYSVCGFAGVYSDLPPYNGSIKQGQTGLLVENTSYKWFAAIDMLIANPDLRRNIAANARRKVLAEQVPAAHAWRYLEAYRSVIEQKKKVHDVNHPITENMPPASTPLVSIVILTFNQLKYTQECLESIQSCTPESHEIIFVDNGSTDGTVEWLKGQAARHENYRVIDNGRNLGFAKGCNQGIAVARGKFILLLNNDVVVTKEWLAGLLESFQCDENTGIVGPMTNNISGSQKVPHVDYAVLSELPNYAASFRSAHRYRRIPSRRVVGFCMLFRRELLEQIGSLDESFGLGNFEDDDLCLRAELAGFQNIIAGDVFVHHYGGVSFEGNNINFSAAMMGNMAIYYRKWNYSLQNETTLRLLPLDAILEARRLAMRTETDAAVETLLQRGIRVAPANPAPYVALAEILITAKRYRDAAEVIAGLPEGADPLLLLNLRAACLEGLGKYDKAKQVACEVLAESPANARSLNLLGILAYRCEEHGDAAKYFDRAMAADPSFGEPCANLGVLKWAAGERDAAFKLLKRAAMLSPLDDEIRSLYYGAACETGHHAQAERRFSEDVAIYPDCHGLTVFLIDVLEKQNKNVEAMRQLETALVRFGCNDDLVGDALEMRKRVGLELKVGVNNLVSLCMIVKNEGQNLAACLASVKPVVDEIVVVDTGSTDRTVEIATIFGARVFNYPWNGNFSDARNYSINQAKGEWIFVLDADEVLSERDYEVFRSVVAKSKRKQVAWAVTTRNYMTDSMQHGWTANSGEYPREERGIGWCPSPKTRLFPRNKRIRFEGPVHEVVEHSLKRLKIAVHHAPFVVHHYGHLDKKGMVSKKQQYYELAKEKLLSRPDDADILTELAIQAGEVARFEEALGLWDRVLEIQENDKQAHFNRSHVLNYLKRYPESVEAAKQALKIDPSMKEAAFYYATGELYAGDLMQAESELFRILSVYHAYPPAVALLTVISLCRGDSEAAQEYLIPLKQTNFAISNFIVDCIHKLADVGRTDLVRNLLQLSVQIGCLPKEALAELDRFTLPRDQTETADLPANSAFGDEASLRSGIMNRAISEAYRFAIRGETDRAVEELLQKGIRASQDDPAPYLALVDILLTEKRFQDAWQVIPEMPKATAAATLLALQAVCQEGMGEYDLARQSAETALDLEPENWRSLNVLGLIAHQNGTPDLATEYFERAMKADPCAAEPVANRGVIWWAAGKQQAGFDLLQRGAALALRDEDIFQLYRSAAVTLGRAEEAAGLFRDKLSHYPESRLLVIALADTLITLGKTGEALDVLLVALSTLGADEELLDAALEMRRQMGPRKPLAGGEQRSVSLCMIVKNEAANLPRCLASVMPVVQEMVVVDTGSTDRTVDIATAFGAHTYNFSWTGSFSDARNFAISKVRGEWILVMDADEMLAVQDQEKLRQTVSSSPMKKEAWSIIVRNYTERVNVQGWTANDGLYPSEERANGWYPAQRAKLFPNDPRFCFSGEVHELVEPSLRRAGITIRTASFTVHHYGELFGSPEELANKQRRYFDLGKQKLAERPNDVVALTELAVQAGELELFDEALLLWDRVLTAQPDRVEALFNKSYALIGLKRYLEGLDASRLALERDPDHKEAAFNFGTCALYVDDPYSAIAMVVPVLARHPDYPLLLALQTVLYLVTGQHDLARTIFTKLESLNYAIADYIRDRAVDLDIVGRKEMARHLRKGGMLLGIDAAVLGGTGE